jgi:bisphosphoglycerate-independent phosphoglycerate mutase (AlkP superfamily)
MRGHSGSNVESWNELEIIMKSLHPKLVVLYLGETDGAGHSGDWDRYLKTIKTADEIVGALWEKIQLDQNYQNKTTLIVTNDHGRHDDSHGGFKNHGDACDGCQHIMFLAIGPDFKKNYQTNTRRTLIDITPTIGKLLKFNPEYAMGGVMSELFKSP